MDPLLNVSAGDHSLYVANSLMILPTNPTCNVSFPLPLSRSSLAAAAEFNICAAVSSMWLNSGISDAPFSVSVPTNFHVTRK